MPTMQVYQHGVTAGIPGNNKGLAGLRGEVVGWSDQVAKRNTAFLRSVYLPDLDGLGISFTLTVKDCPPTHAEWAALRKAWFERQRRAGMLRAHWVTEWQRRGVPHLHGVVYWPACEGDGRTYAKYLGSMLDGWLALTEIYGAAHQAQHTSNIYDSLGWLKYLAKHAARGAAHYQRAAEGIPEGWKKTGRMWGYLGDWPRRDVLKLSVGNDAFFRYRRLVRSYRLADARASGSGRRIRQARRMLQDSDRARCEVRGVSEWVPQGVSLRMVELLAAMGHQVTQVDG